MKLNIKKGLTEPECERYRRERNFTDEELAIFNLRVKNLTMAEIQQKLNAKNMPLSEPTIWRRLKSIKEKMRKIK